MTDLTGRTNGAGTISRIAGKNYRWTININGKLEAHLEDKQPELYYAAIRTLPDHLILQARARSQPS